jgi:hypothetical protein
MEGLVKEARKHGIEESYGDPAVQDARSSRRCSA